MKKQTILSIIITSLIFIISCDGKGPNVAKDNRKALDSINAKLWTDSTIKKMDKDITEKIINEDTIGMYLAPVKILSSKVVKSESGSYRNVYLEFKNLTNKKIEAIKFSWYGLNAFGEAASMGIVDGYGGGFTDRGLAANGSDSGEWEVLSRDLKKIKIAWIKEVVFEDGTKWQNK